MKKLVLDTNAYSRLAAGEVHLLDVLGEADVVYLSVFVLGELFAEFKGGKHEKQNRARRRGCGASNRSGSSCCATPASNGASTS